MAEEQSTRTFSTVAAGRAGSPYLERYLEPAETERTAQFERSLQMAREGREEESFSLQKQREQRLEQKTAIQEERQRQMDERRMRLDEWRLQKDQENRERELRSQELQAARYDMAMKRQQAEEDKRLKDEMLQTKAAELSSRIYGLDPNRPDYRDNVKSIISDPANLSILNSKYGREPRAIQKEQDLLHNNMAEFLQSEQKKVGHTGSIYDLPRTQTGEWDLHPEGKIYGQGGIFPEASVKYQAQLQESNRQREAQAQAAAARGESASYKDAVTGETIRITGKKPVDIIYEEAKKWKANPSIYALAPGQSTENLSVKQGSFKDGKFVENESGDHIYLVDKTSDPIIKERIYTLDQWNDLTQKPQKVQRGTTLDRDTAMRYYNAAGGDKEKARAMAIQDGYTIQ